MDRGGFGHGMMAVVSLELAMPAHPALARAVRWVFTYVVKFLFRFYCPLEVFGRENLPPMPYILCSNHSSHIDGVALMAASGAPFDCFGLVAAKDYFSRNPIVRRLVPTLLNLLPVERTHSGRSLKEAVRVCRLFLQGKDRSLIIFPEGTRSIDGTIGTFKRGAAVLSTELMIPIVPAYLDGTRNVLAKHRYFLRPCRIRATIGAPIYPPARNVERRRLCGEMTQEAFRRVAGMQRTKE